MAVPLSSLPHLPFTTECTVRLWVSLFPFLSTSSQYLPDFCNTQSNHENPSRTHLQLWYHPGKQKQHEDLQFFFIKPYFPPFQLAPQLLHSDLATLLVFSSALCYPPCLPTNKEGTGWFLQAGVGCWLPTRCFRSEAANNAQW